MTKWKVVVKNIGVVYKGTNGKEAKRLFNIYAEDTDESVTLFADERIVKEREKNYES